MLNNKWKKYSYADQKLRTARIRAQAAKIIAIIFLYIMLTNVLFPMIVMESASMQPTINPGERFIFFAFNLHYIFPRLSLFDGVSYKHGDIVMINTNAGEGKIFSTFADKLCRFLTLGKIGLPNNNDRFFIKRIIGVPGDEVTISHFTAQVRSANTPHTLTEFEFSKRRYDPDIPQNSSLWDDAIPFSGNMSKVLLGENEYFVLSDDRSNTNDSRTWGPVLLNSISSKAIFRYWPLNRIGIL